MDRTIASARSFLSGLFSSEKKDNKIQAKGPFEIEVHNFPDEDMVNTFDSFFHLISKPYFSKFPNPKVFPILKKCPVAPVLYSSLDDNHDLKKARQALITRIGKYLIIKTT